MINIYPLSATKSELTFVAVAQPSPSANEEHIQPAWTTVAKQRLQDEKNGVLPWSSDESKTLLNETSASFASILGDLVVAEVESCQWYFDGAKWLSGPPNTLRQSTLMEQEGLAVARAALRLLAETEPPERAVQRNANFLMDAVARALIATRRHSTAQVSWKGKRVAMLTVESNHVNECEYNSPFFECVKVIEAQRSRSVVVAVAEATDIASVPLVELEQNHFHDVDHMASWLLRAGSIAGRVSGDPVALHRRAELGVAAANDELRALYEECAEVWREGKSKSKGILDPDAPAVTAFDPLCVVAKLDDSHQRANCRLFLLIRRAANGQEPTAGWRVAHAAPLGHHGVGVLYEKQEGKDAAAANSSTEYRAVIRYHHHAPPGSGGETAMTRLLRTLEGRPPTEGANTPKSRFPVLQYGDEYDLAVVAVPDVRCDDGLNDGTLTKAVEAEHIRRVRFERFVAPGAPQSVVTGVQSEREVGASQSSLLRDLVELYRRSGVSFIDVSAWDGIAEVGFAGRDASVVASYSRPVAPLAVVEAQLKSLFNGAGRQEAHQVLTAFAFGNHRERLEDVGAKHAVEREWCFSGSLSESEATRDFDKEHTLKRSWIRVRSASCRLQDEEASSSPKTPESRRATYAVEWAPEQTGATPSFKVASPATEGDTSAAEDAFVTVELKDPTMRHLRDFRSLRVYARDWSSRGHPVRDPLEDDDGVLWQQAELAPRRLVGEVSLSTLCKVASTEGALVATAPHEMRDQAAAVRSGPLATRYSVEFVTRYGGVAREPTEAVEDRRVKRTAAGDAPLRKAPVVRLPVPLLDGGGVVLLCHERAYSSGWHEAVWCRIEAVGTDPNEASTLPEEISYEWSPLDAFGYGFRSGIYPATGYLLKRPNFELRGAFFQYRLRRTTATSAADRQKQLEAPSTDGDTVGVARFGWDLASPDSKDWEAQARGLERLEVYVEASVEPDMLGVSRERYQRLSLQKPKQGRYRRLLVEVDRGEEGSFSIEQSKEDFREEVADLGLDGLIDWATGKLTEGQGPRIKAALNSKVRLRLLGLSRAQRRNQSAGRVVSGGAQRERV